MPAGVAAAAILAWMPGNAAEPVAASGADAQAWDQVVDRAVHYLQTKQADDGSWSEAASPGVTGIVLTGMLRTGKVSPKDPVGEKAIRYILSLVNTKAGHIAGKDPKVQLQNYVTSINVMALSAAGRDDYKQVIGDAVKFLKKLQWDEDEGKNSSDDFYGGAGYDSKSRPDLSNTQFFLEALKDAGVSKDDPAFRKALTFVSRCQNIKDPEYNDLPWAGKINDGSFIYSPAAGGQTKGEPLPDGGLPGYGSMTYAGIKSMIYCGASEKDPRIKKAYEWIQHHYTVDQNPGLPAAHGRWGLFYYYHTMAKCLDTLGIDDLVDAQGNHHSWRADITAALAKRQRPDGSWLNDENHWMEGDPNLDTGYALMALAYCKPKK